MEMESFVDRLYEAAAVPALWDDVLARLTKRIGAKWSIISVARGTDFVRTVASSAGIVEVVADYSAKYPNNERIVRLLSAGGDGFVQDADLLRPGEVHLDRSYEEYLIPRGFGAGTATVMQAPSGDNMIVHSEFSYTGSPISTRIIGLLNELRPHFARSALLSSRFRMEQAHGMTKALETIGLAGAVLRTKGTILAANTLFHGFVPDVVQDRKERVTLASAGADDLLGKTLARHRAGGRTKASASILIPALADRPPVIVHIIPSQGAANDIFSQSATILLITPVDRAAVPTADVLQGLFDLTPAEARVARGIGLSQSVDMLAASQGVARETVRSQLKQVLAKTGLSRQAELVSLLAGLPATR
jgi:DNA-binding CsgD family transcriptional regulator